METAGDRLYRNVERMESVGKKTDHSVPVLDDTGEDKKPAGG